MSYWTAINTLFLLGSLGMYFVVTFTMYSNGMFLSLPSAFSFVGETQSLDVKYEEPVDAFHTGSSCCGLF